MPRLTEESRLSMFNQSFIILVNYVHFIDVIVYIVYKLDTQYITHFKPTYFDCTYLRKLLNSLKNSCIYVF